MNTTEIRPARSFPFARKEHSACAFNISCLRASLRSSVMPSIRCITASIFSLYASVNITRTASRSNHRQLLWSSTANSPPNINIFNIPLLYESIISRIITEEKCLIYKTIIKNRS